MNSNIILTQSDSNRIRNLLSAQSVEDYENLETEVERAKVIPDEEVPQDVVTMNSTIRYLNVDTGKECVATIVYPNEANFSDGKISILASVGSALIGLRKGQEIKWKFPDGVYRTLRVTEIISQN